MSTNTPYTPPKSAVADMTQEYGELKVFSASGRIGRARYLGWSMGLMLLGMLAIGAMAGLGAVVGGKALAGTLYVVGVIALVVVSAMLAIQRLHDLDKSGWLFLVMLIPLIGAFFTLYVMFAPGSRQANQYGNPPPPNTTGVLILAWVMPAIMIIGILAAIAIPTYQGYVLKAKQSQMQMQPLEQQQ